MIISPARLDGVFRITPQIWPDDRGQFSETYRSDSLPSLGMPDAFVQDNVSHSKRGVLRGLHFQNPKAQAKFLTVLSGEIYDVVVDLRPHSVTFGQWEGFPLNGKALHQIFVPAGFAHGFCVLSKETLISYKCAEFYDPRCQHTLAWDDPQLGIKWPIENPILSSKDRRGALFSELKAQLFSSDTSL